MNILDFETRWPEVNGKLTWKDLEHGRSMTPGRWYQEKGDIKWSGGRAWHKNSELFSPAPGYIDPQERGRVRFDIYDSEGGGRIDRKPVNCKVQW